MTRRGGKPDGLPDGATYLKPDGFYRAQNVLDNLIYRGDIPIMIGAFIDPGINVADGKSIRQDEYDARGTGILR